MRTFDIYRMFAPVESVFTKSLYGCGSGSYGLGLGDSVSKNTFARLSTARDCQSINAGWQHSFAFFNGILQATGTNGNNQLGFGSGVNQVSVWTPVPLASSTPGPDSSPWKQAGTLDFGSIFLNDSGQLWACGYNNYGELGHGTIASASPFTRVATDKSWISVMCFSSISCAQCTDSFLYVCGLNDYGQLCLGDTQNKTAFTKIPGSSSFKSFSSSGAHTLVVMTSGELYGVGYNGWGQLGQGNTVNRTSLTRIGTASNWTQARASGNASYALNTNGELYGAGANSAGNPVWGLSGTVDKTTLTRIGTASDWRSIFAGYQCLAAINAAHELYIAGSRNLGLGSYSSYKTTLRKVGIAKNWDTVSIGGSVILALTL